MKKIKRFAMILFLTTCLMFSSCEVIGAMTCLEPGKVEGYEYIHLSYDPYGNVLALIDADDDGVVDFGQVFQLLKEQRSGQPVYMPFGSPVTPDQAKEMMDSINTANREHGFQNKCYDLDLGNLRNLSDRNV